MKIGFQMMTIIPNMSKSDGPLTVCNCTDTNIKREQRKCIAYLEGKKGYCSYYRFSIGACANYDGYFSALDKG
jgi:hypothetical protein